MVLDTKIFQTNTTLDGRTLSSCEQMITGLKVGDWTRKFVHYKFPIMGQNERMTPTTTIPFHSYFSCQRTLGPLGKGIKTAAEQPQRQHI